MSIIKILSQGGSTGLVVMGEDSNSEGRGGFESGWTFFTHIFVVNILFLKIQK